MAEEQKDLVAVKVAFAGGTDNVALSGEVAWPAAEPRQTFAAAGYTDGATIDAMIMEADDGSQFELHRQAVYNTAAGGSIARSTGTLIAGSNGASLVSFAAADLIVVDVFTAAGRMAGLARIAALETGKAPTDSPTITGIMKFAGAKGTASTHGTGFSLAAADSGGLKVCTAAITVTVPSAATLAPNSGDFFSVTIYASSGAVTLDGPGATNLALAEGDIAFVFARNGGAIVAGKAPVTVLS